jgi:hypothetical protein
VCPALNDTIIYIIVPKVNRIIDPLAYVFLYQRSKVVVGYNPNRRAASESTLKHGLLDKGEVVFNWEHKRIIGQLVVVLEVC